MKFMHYGPVIQSVRKKTKTHHPNALSKQ